MSGKTEISWATDTWSPVLGCSPKSSGCQNCYAIRTTWRLAHNPHPKVSGPRKGLVELTSAGVLRWTGKIACLEDELATPFRWKRSRRIFVCPQGDLFHERVPTPFIRKVWAVMAALPRHTFIVLTKRPDRMWDVLRDITTPYHVWIGVSVENQQEADKRIPILLDTPSAHRFVSYEPALCPVRFRNGILGPVGDLAERFGNALINWVIVGGESGPNARPCNVEWIRSIVRQCKAAQVPCFVKQLGRDCEYGRNGEPWWTVDRAGRNPLEWPEDLRVQEYPQEMSR